jgi:hypothetical protein
LRQKQANFKFTPLEHDDIGLTNAIMLQVLFSCDLLTKTGSHFLSSHSKRHPSGAHGGPVRHMAGRAVFFLRRS